MRSQLVFLWRCVKHLVATDHWPVDPKQYGDFFLCQRCDKGTPLRNPIRALPAAKAMRALSYG